MCVLACSQVFTQDDNDGSVEVLDRHPSLTLIEKIKEAVRNCPAQVFRIEDEDEAREISIEDVK
jgi:ferredoxin